MNNLPQDNTRMRFVILCVLGVMVLLGVGIGVYLVTRSPATLRILWAEWEPSKVLREVTQDFTKETGISVEVVEVPWNDFQTVAYRDLDRNKPEYDIIIGDSQWLGRNVLRGERYLDLTSFVKKSDLLTSFVPLSLAAYGEYPPQSGRYYAVPVLGDGMGFAYRKDLFENRAERKAFLTRYGYDLAVPDTWTELRDIAEFFFRPDEGTYGISFPTTDGYDSVTMTFENMFFSYGGDIKAINSDVSVSALELFRELYSFSSQGAGGDDSYGAPATNIAEGKVVMALNYFTFYPSLTERASNPYADVTGYFIVPEGPGGRFSALGGQGASIVYHSNNKRIAKKFLEWWVLPSTQKRWVEEGGVTLNKEILNSPNFETLRPYNKAQRETLSIMKDFWSVPEYPELLDVSQKLLHDYLSGITPAKETLDAIAHRWDNIFRTSPYNILK